MSDWPDHVTAAQTTFAKHGCRDVDAEQCERIANLCCRSNSTNPASYPAFWLELARLIRAKMEYTISKDEGRAE